MVANADGDFCDEEAKLIEHFFDLYDISNSIELLTTLFGNFKAKDAEALTVFFQDNSEMDIGRFLYLFEYLEINIISRNQMDAEDDTTSDKDDVLEFNFIEPRFTTGELDYRCRAITDEPVNNEQFCIFLNEMYQEGNIKIETNGDIVIFSSEEQKEESILTSILYKKITPHNGDLILSCENNEIIFTDNGVFIPIEGKSKSKIVYVTIIGARMFIDWISKYHSSEYVLTRFDGEGKGMFTTRYVVYYGNSFIKHSVNGEFYDSGCSSTYVLDEDNTYKNDILLWSTDGDEDNIEANEEYYSSHTSFRFGKKDQ